MPFRHGRVVGCFNGVGTLTVGLGGTLFFIERSLKVENPGR